LQTFDVELHAIHKGLSFIKNIERESNSSTTQ